MDGIPAQNMKELLYEGLRDNSLELALKALNAGAWTWHAGTQNVSWNEQCYKLFGLEPGPVSVEDMMNKVIEDDKDRFLEMWNRITSQPGWFEMEFRIMTDEKVQWIRISGYHISGENSEPNYAAGAMVDITEEKYFNQKLHDANFTKDRFFSIIAHDLRSPFTSILGFSRLLNEEYDDFSNDDRKMMIKQILTSTETTFQLLDNLLTWAKTQLGRTSFNPEYFDIESLIVETINLSIAQAKIKGISLKVLIADKSTVYADVNMIRTVLRNLLSNSIKFSYEGAMITIEASRVDDKARITIIDTGMGIEPKTLKALFSLDEKVCSTKGTANEKGTGLGLILCKEFVEKNGGAISVESAVGEGSKFSFTIPLKGDTA